MIAFHASELKKKGHRVRLLLPGLSDGCGILGGIRKWFKKPDVKGGRPSHYDGLGLDIRRVQTGRKITASDVPDGDVVIATWWETVEWMSLLPDSKGARAYFIQGHEVFDYLPVARVRATYTAATHRIAVSRWLQQLIQSTYGGDVDLACNAVDPDLFGAEPRGRQAFPTVGFAYTTTSWKRVDLILEALRRLVLEFPELRIVAFGQQPMQPASDLSFRTTYFEAPAQSQIARAYASCDAWVTATNNEGFGLPAIEAMACRTPVVASRSGWPVDAIEHEVNGCLADVDDVEGLVSGLRHILSLDDGKWRAMSELAQQTALALTPEASAQQFEAALYRAAQRSGGVAA